MTGNKVKRLTKDMKANGYDQTKPVVVSEVNGKNIIQDGHHRVEAAKKAGISQIPIVKKPVSAEEGQKLEQEAGDAAAERDARRR